jgi:hypothetical protein
MNWAESIDMYCERTDAGLWSEPVNALTNLAFIAVAIVLWRSAGRQPARDIRLLLGLIAAVGVGSLVFHTVATRWAAVLDIGFIGIFVLAYFQRFQVRILGTTEGAAWRGLGGFVLFAGLFGLAVRALPTLPLNGSEIYLPPFALLLFCAWRALPLAPATTPWLLRASGLFIVSLLCRAIDQAVCAAWPLGTHLGWHLVNAGMLYCCMRGMLTRSAAAATRHAQRAQSH